MIVAAMPKHVMLGLTRSVNKPDVGEREPLLGQAKVAVLVSLNVATGAVVSRVTLEVSSLEQLKFPLALNPRRISAKAMETVVLAFIVKPLLRIQSRVLVSLVLQTSQSATAVG